MRAALKALAALLVGALLTLLVVELLLRALPVIDGRIRDRDESQWPLRNYQPQQPYVYSFGWDLRQPQQGRTNNFGQLAPFDFQPGKAKVAVIGDSFVESAMNAYEDALHAQLAALRGDPQSVIGLAGSGLSLADQLVLAGQARDALAPPAYVFVIIDNDIADSQRPRRGWHHFAADGRGGLRTVYLPLRGGDEGGAGPLASSALYRYLRRNLGWTPPQPAQLLADLAAWLSPGRQAQAQSAPDRSGDAAAIAHFLRELPAATGVPPACVALLFDSDRLALYGKPRASSVDAPASRAALLRGAQAAGFAALDLAPRFAARYREQGQRFDHSPSDSHWNRLGHQVAAEAARDALQACPALN